MKIVAISDIHGILPDPASCPPCDLLLIAGDVCPELLDEHQLQWLDTGFRNWLDELPTENIIGIAGNHDAVFQNQPHEVLELLLSWDYLLNESIIHDGLKIYGIPFIPFLMGWSFYADDYLLANMYEQIPLDTDIILSHGPPLGLGDMTGPLHGSSPVGSVSALEAVQRVEPLAFVCGHIHEARGCYQHRDTTVWNVAAVTEFYEPIDDPFIEIEL